jgi:hypothetical protein
MQNDADKKMKKLLRYLEKYEITKSVNGKQLDDGEYDEEGG